MKEVLKSVSERRSAGYRKIKHIFPDEASLLSDEVCLFILTL